MIKLSVILAFIPYVYIVKLSIGMSLRKRQYCLHLFPFRGILEKFVVCVLCDFFSWELMLTETYIKFISEMNLRWVSSEKCGFVSKKHLWELPICNHFFKENF